MALVLATNTYITEADATAYIALMGLDTLSVAETMLIRATKAIDRLYGGRFIGTRTLSTQALLWPRTVANSLDSDGNVRDFTVIPTELGYAVVELALLMDAGKAVFAQPDPQLTKESVEVDVLKQSREFATSFAVNPLHGVALILRPLLVSASTVRLARG